METAAQNLPLITEDTVVFGILMAILALVFYTSSLDNRFAKKFYAVIPPLLLCYFLPGLLNSFGIISGEHSNIYFIASNYLLPACLVLFTLSLNLGELWKMRKNAGIMFLAGMVGVVLGGPIAVWIMAQFAPQVVSGETWKALSTLAGSWIGEAPIKQHYTPYLNPSPKTFQLLSRWMCLLPIPGWHC